MNYQYGLMPEEIQLYKRFCAVHKSCKPEVREQLMEESVAPAYTAIILHMSTIGMNPVVKCYVCGVEYSIACEERINSA